MATHAPELITLTGPPRNASAIVRLEAGGQRVLTVALKLAGGIAVHKAYVRPFGEGTSEIRLRLPREMPPGRYSGEVMVGESRMGIMVEVEPVEHLRVQPQRSRLSLPPGGTVEFGVQVENRGNVPIEVPKAVALDLDDDEGQDRALGRALRARLGPGESRVDRFFEEIREAHGGEGRVQVLAGAGRLPPAESRALRCQLEAPEMVRAGRSYFGAWELGDAAHVLLVDVTKAAPDIRGGGPR